MMMLYSTTCVQHAMYEPDHPGAIRVVQMPPPAYGPPLSDYPNLPWYCNQHELMVAVLGYLAWWVAIVVAVDQVARFIPAAWWP